MTEVEILIDSLEGLRAAESGGAQRFELVAQPAIGGTTPSAGLIERVCAEATVPVAVLIRPRGGGFQYSPDELAVMDADVRRACALGAAGIVIGALDRAGALDSAPVQRWIELARPVPLTFHRALDCSRDALEALERCMELGCARVLSSGGAASAWAGRFELARLVRRAGTALCVVAGGGVRPDHARELVAASGVRAVHASAFSERARAWPAALPLGAERDPENERFTDAARVRALVAALP